jgi:site-specific DNA recombinase
MRIGIYCRVSTENQKDNTSLSNQEELGISFCKKHNYEYEIYREVFSGKDSNRIELSKLEYKLLDKELDGVWLYNWDRMIRDKSVMIYFEELVNKSGCKVFVDDKERNILDNEGDILDFEFRGMLSSMERRSINRRMKNGMKVRLEKNEVFMGIVGIGYKKEGKKIVIDEIKSKLVQDCFKRFLYGSIKSYRDLVFNLKNKYKDLDKRINEKSLSRILKDEKYKGVYNLKWNGEEFNIEIGRIIDDELFDKVQEKISYLKGLRKGNSKNTYILKGKVYCDYCNNKMWIRGGGEENNGQVYRYYFCKEKFQKIRNNFDDRFINKNEIKCQCPEQNKISVFRLEEIIWDVMFDILGRSETIKEDYKRKYKNKVQDKNYFEKMLKYNKGLIEKYERRKKDTLVKFIDGELSKDDKDYILKELEQDNKKTSKEIKTIKSEYEKYKNVDHVLNYLDGMIVDLKKKYEIESLKDKKNIVERYINMVSVRYLGRDEKNTKIYEIKVKMKIEDEKLNEESVLEVNNEHKNTSIYILNHKSMENCDLIYKIRLKIESRILITKEQYRVESLHVI